LARNEHCTDSFGLPSCSLVSPSETRYLPPVPAPLTGYTWARGPGFQPSHPSPPGPTGPPVQTVQDVLPLPVLGMAAAVSTEGDGPASVPLAEDPRSRVTFPAGSSPARENCWYPSAMPRPNRLTGSSARSGSSPCSLETPDPASAESVLGTAAAAAREGAYPPPQPIRVPPSREVPFTTSTYPVRARGLCQSARFAASPSQGCVSAARGISPRSSPSLLSARSGQPPCQGGARPLGNPSLAPA